MLACYRKRVIKSKKEGTKWLTWFGRNLQVLVVGGSSMFDFLSAFSPFFFVLLFLLLQLILSSSLLYFFPFGFLSFIFFPLVFSPLCSVLYSIFYSLLDPPVCSPVLSPFDSFLPLPFIGFHATYLPRTIVRPKDIVFQSDWGTNSPVYVGLLFISIKAWEIHPYLSGIVIFMEIRFALWVLVGPGCRCFTISFPSLQVCFQHSRKKKKNSACLKRCRFGLGITIS